MTSKLLHYPQCGLSLQQAKPTPWISARHNGQVTETRRGRPRTPLLSRESIVAATLRVIDEEGVAAVGMRSVARALGVDAKSLYNHVDGKDGLLDAVAEQLLGGLVLPSRTGDARRDLHA
ncbi:helix-turn-helix transcriptional regulator, partial [Lentzea sp. PSKA42]|nr:helix-turn-helix transcriptional regulator [Lentzea indica]